MKKLVLYCIKPLINWVFVLYQKLHTASPVGTWACCNSMFSAAAAHSGRFMWKCHTPRVILLFTAAVMRQTDKKSVHKQHIKLQMARDGHRVLFMVYILCWCCKPDSSATHAPSELAKYLAWRRRRRSDVDVKLSIHLISFAWAWKSCETR